MAGTTAAISRPCAATITRTGQHDAAHRCYTDALALAGQTDEAEIQVHALANMAIRAGILRRPRQALRYVAAAERAIPATEPLGRVPAMLQMRRGRLLAMLGDSPAAEQAFNAARRSLDRDRTDPPTWLGFFGHAEIDAVEADAAHDLRQPHRGVTLIERSLASYDATYARNRCLHLVRLAKARASAGQFDGAAEAATLALDLLDHEVSSVRVASELRVLAEQLHPHRTLPAVSDTLARYRTSPYGVIA